MKPTRRRASIPWASIGRPKIQASPSLAGKRPVSIFIVVVFPHPLDPRKPKISPRVISKFTESTAVKLPKRRVSPCARIAISFASGFGLSGKG